MASTSVSGIACAALTAALALSSLGAAPAIAQPSAPTYDVTVEIDGLRDAKGVVRLCMTADRASFPQCQKGTSMSGTVAASKGPVRFTFHHVPAGTYAIAAFHDANRNGKMDKMMAMPTEGFAFSDNPPMRPRAPHFDEADFVVSGDRVEKLRVRYIL